METPSVENFRATLLAEVNRLLLPHAGMGVYLANMCEDMFMEEGDAGFRFYGTATLFCNGVDQGTVWVRGKAHIQDTLGCRSPVVTHVQLKRPDGSHCWSVTDGAFPSREPLDGWTEWNQSLKRTVPPETLCTLPGAI